MSQSLPIEEQGRWGRALEPDAIALTDTELREAACRVDSREAKEHPEKAWTRYLRAMALIALRRWISQRKADLTVGPELEPEDPLRLLALNGRAAQLVCCSPMDESVEVPIEVWQRSETAPQLLLLAQVDEDNGLVHFPGALDGESVMAELRQRENSDQATVPIGLKRFDGGLERLLRWMTLLRPVALARVAQFGEDQSAERQPMPWLTKGIQALLDGAIDEILQSLHPQPLLGLSIARGAGRGTVHLLNPRIECESNGMPVATVICSQPTLWVQEPLAEIQLLRDGKLLWRARARLQHPITTPLPWPLPPLAGNELIEVRLRPWGASGGIYSTLALAAPSAERLSQGDAEISLRLSETNAIQNLTNAVTAIALEVIIRVQSGSEE